MSILRALASAAFFAALIFAAPAFAAEPLLLQNPTVSATQIAFVYGGDIWTVPRSGGRAARIVTGYGVAGSPRFSPDGSTIAFSASYDGNVNVYTVPAMGGEPRRLTWHPGADIVIGWTPDGSKVLFVSGRNSPNDSMQPYEVSRDGGIPVELPLPDITDGSFSPDGTHLAYVPNNQWEPYWQHYRGGQTTPIWIANMADSSVVSIPHRDNSNDRSPMWVGDEVYFLSDRSGHFALYSYNTHTHAVETRVPNPSGFDMVAASSGDGVIVYSKFDSIHLYDPRTHEQHEVPIEISAEMPELRPHFVGVAGDIQNVNISPTGVRAVFEAHGDILTVPADNGSVRNITQTPNVEERDPAWSPDGRWIAYFSDASGEYTLRLRDQRGLRPERVFKLEPYPSFYYSPTWSPDSKKIAYNDKHGGLYYIDITEQNPHAVKVAEQPYETFDSNTFEQAWSPDSRYIAYIKQLPNFLHAVNIYDTQDHIARQISDGMANAVSPAFDRNGKFLYFLASTDTGFTVYGLDMESDQRPAAYSVYAVTLHKSEASPVAPETGDEPVKGGEEEGAPKPQAPHAAATPKAEEKPQPPAIDFDNIDQRIVALPIPEANYDKLQAAGDGTIFIQAAPLTSVSELPEGESLLRFDLASRKLIPFADGIRDFDVSADGKKMLLVRGLFQLSFAIVPTVQPVPAGMGTLATAGLQVWSDPKQEWAQEYHETWRIERDWFYDPHYHGLNLAAAEKAFSAFLPGLASRADFTYLTREMIGYLEVGHLWVSGPPAFIPNRVSTGMLGADYAVDHDRFKFAHIYSGENWNPQLKAPLTQPGVNVHEGEYLLAVNGKQIYANREVYAYFENTAGQQTTITVGPNPDGTGSRDVVVVPLASESALRNLAWIEDNRRTVDRLSGGKIGYVYMPDTEYGGFTNFNRYFFSQVNKEGIIIDERYNHGGQLADYVIDVLSRKARAIVVGRDGKPYTDPPLAISGPKVMLINEYAGSGGDAMPWLFRKAGLGPLVGVRTWGGLVGIGGYPPLMDGGSVMAPRVAIGGLNGHWEVEGHGIPPDIEVVQDPKLIREGHDPQLEAGVAEAMKLLREHPVPHYEPPPYPDHHPVIPQP